MNEDFDEYLPGSFPENWNSYSGNWTLIDDEGNIVYYQQENRVMEALLVSRIENTNWVNYTFQLELKFIEGNGRRGDAGALILFHYQSSARYYFLWENEYENQLELFNHRIGSTG